MSLVSERTIFVLICQLGYSMYQFGASRLASSFDLCVIYLFHFLAGVQVLINGDGDLSFKFIS